MPSLTKTPKYRTKFTVSAHVYTPSEKDIKESWASIDRLKGLMPDHINPANHPTILYVVGNLFVAGLLNKNDDAVTLEDALATYRSFEGQQINIEHSRGDVVGYIVKSGLSEFGTDRLITEDEARAANKPFNVAVVIALWKVVDHDLVRYILESAENGTPNELSLSFEVGFDDYSIVTVPKGTANLSLVTRTIDPTTTDFLKWDMFLRANGGSGVHGSKRERVGRVLKNGMIPLGGGIVAMPAGPVKGLVPITADTAVLEESTQGNKFVARQEADAGMYEFSSTQVTFSSTDAADFLSYANTIPDEDLYNGEEDSPSEKYGRETEPHVTAYYGIKGNEAAPLELSLQGSGPVKVKLGEITAFVNENKPYDVLKVDVESDDLCRLHALIGESCDCEDQWPVYHPHLTVAYLKKGLSAKYIGDKRFAGKEYTFNSLTWSPAEGARSEIQLVSFLPAQITAESVYNQEEDYLMSAIPSRFIKLPPECQATLRSLKEVDASLTHVDITLSDGRVIKSACILDEVTVQSDIEYTGDGVKITSVTPGVPIQADDPTLRCPDKTVDYPTTRPEARLGADVAQEIMDVKQRDPAFASEKEPYGDVSYADPGYQEDKKKRYPIDTEEHIRAAWSYINQKKNADKYTSEQVSKIKSRIVSAWKKKINPDGPESASAALEAIQASLAQLVNTLSSVKSLTTGVSQDKTSSMKNLDDLKQLQASIKTTDKVEDLREAFANVSKFAEVIALASEEQIRARQEAEEASKVATAAAAEAKARLEELSAKYEEIVAAQEAAAAEQAYQSRMATVEEVFAFDDDIRAELVDEIKACANDEAFASWLARAKKLFKSQIRAETKVEKKQEKDMSKKDEMRPRDDEKDDGDDECDAAAKTALASAAQNVTDASVHNLVDPNAMAGKSLFEKYKEAFANNVSIDGVTIKQLRETAAKTPVYTQ